MRQAAADQLADRLKELADSLLADGRRSRRVPYGRANGIGPFRPRSPKGLILDERAPQLLLPDGRLWHYHTRRNAEGIYYDARLDHVRSMHGAIPLGGGDYFSSLGAVIDKYNFGYRHTGAEDSAAEFELGAIVGKGVDSPTYVPAAEAFADIVRGL